MTPNYMVFTCNLSRSAERAKKTGNPVIASSTAHAISRAREAYKAKDWTAAEQWRNAAERSSLEMC